MCYGRNGLEINRAWVGNIKTRTQIILLSIIFIVGSVSILYAVQIPHYSLEIKGMKDTYHIGEQYSFYYTLSGFGHTCHSWIVSYPDQNGEFNQAGEAIDCSRPTNKELSYDSRKDSRIFSSKIPEIEGKYNVTVSLEDLEPVIYEFRVISSSQNAYELDEALCIGGRGYIVNDECERIGKYDSVTGLPIVENKEQCDMLEGKWDEKQKTCDSKYGKENEN